MKWFKLTKVRRFAILATTLVGALLAIILGSVFYVSKEGTLGMDYGGGAEYVVKINPGLNANVDSDEVAKSIGERVDALGVRGVKVNAEKGANGSASVRVEYPGITSETEKNAIEKLITSKPHLSLTDIYGNALFTENGAFNNSLDSSTTKGALKDPELVDWDKDSRVPIESGGAKAITGSDGSHKAQITMESDVAGVEWTKATKYISALPKGQNMVIAWLDLNSFIAKAKADWSQEWTKAHHNPFIFAHVGETLVGPQKKPAILKQHTVPAKNYLISSATVGKALSGRSFVIEGSFTIPQTQELSRKINYGISNYKLEIASSNFVDASYGANSFNKVIIAGAVVFAIIALFLVANYGLLGALSTISIGLYIFLTLLMFTVMRGEYSPEAIAALIIGIGMSVDANIITFERLKSEVYGGASLKKANIRANKRSISTIFDANITTLIVAFVLFYFGTRTIVALSVTLIISIFFTLVIMLGFTRFLSTMLVNTGVFDKRKKLLGLRPKFDNAVQSKLDKPDYIRKSKWFATGSAVVLGIAIIVFSIFAGLAGTFKSGFALSQEFKGGTIIKIEAPSGTLDNSSADIAIKELQAAGATTDDIHVIYSDEAKSAVKEINVNVDKDLELNKLNHFFHSKSQYKFYGANTSTDVAKKLVRDAMIAIAIAIAMIVLYTLIRFKWTYSFAAIVALVHDGLIVTAVFVIARIQISPVFIAGLLTVIGYSINDTIVTFDRIRERMNNHVGELNAKSIKLIANDAIKNTIKRSVLTSFTTVLAVLVLMMFGNATKMSFNIAMLVGLIAGTYSSIVIASYLWVKLETYRQKRIKEREAKGFWKTEGVQEQTFSGINDFKA